MSMARVRRPLPAPLSAGYALCCCRLYVLLHVTLTCSWLATLRLAVLRPRSGWTSRAAVSHAVATKTS